MSEEKLKNLRQEIDQLDAHILSGLVKRFALTASVASTKQDGLIFRPGREADLLRNLIEEGRGQLDPRLVESLWRQIIAFSIAGQKPLTIAHAGGHDIAASARFRFAAAADYLDLPRPADVLAAVEGGEADLGVLPHWDSDDWWRMLAERRAAGADLAIAAVTPLTPQTQTAQSVVIARHMPDPSRRDMTLCHVDGELIMQDGHHPDRADAIGIFQQP